MFKEWIDSEGFSYLKSKFLPEIPLCDGTTIHIHEKKSYKLKGFDHWFSLSIGINYVSQQ